MNIVQTLRYARRLLKSPDATDAEKAVFLCWIFNDVGDLHQPCHSTALYSAVLFPDPDGDKGANLIKTEPRGNLHSLWDQFPGERDGFREARNRAIAIVNDAAHRTVGNKAAECLDESVWLAESHELAKSAVYNHEVMGHARAHAEETTLPPIRLTQQYLRTGGKVAEQRVIEAGYRLGARLKELIE